MTRISLLTVFLGALFVSASARLYHDDPLATQARQLLQNARCPAGCEAGSGGVCIPDSTTAGFRCTACAGTLVLNGTDGTCGCPAGKYHDGSGNDYQCTDCPKGSFCLGGTFTGKSDNAPTLKACTDYSDGLTTVGLRSTSKKQCVNSPGYYYSTTGTTADPVATQCDVDTYGPGLKKQRACVPCPSGFTTNGANKQNSARACVVPAGWYLKAPGQVAPCPRGEYKVGFNPDPSCTKCASGVTTLQDASTQPADCKVVLPGVYPSGYTSSGGVNATATCPQKYYCPGGTATAAWTPSSTLPTNAGDGVTIIQCSKGLWTQGMGAQSSDECLVPPGFYYNTAQQTTQQCSGTSYRADWQVYNGSIAQSCVKCASDDSIFVDYVDQISVYYTDGTQASPQAVAGSAGACYILPGMGMYYNPTTGYRARNCASNNYGVAAKTYGLAAFPCRDCPIGMETSTNSNTHPNSAHYYSTDGSGHGGFTSPLACVTQAGYGYNGRIASMCGFGYWNPADSYGTCTACGFGLTTAQNASTSPTQCVLAQGYGYYNGAITACPVGTYNNVTRNDNTTACDVCSSGTTTSQEGAVSPSDCNVCAAGYGASPSAATTSVSDCANQCGGNAGANYGPAGRQTTDWKCVSCPAQTTGFSYDFNLTNANYTPAVVAALGAQSPADCLSEFAQINDGAWSISISTATTNTAQPTFDACIQSCKSNSACEYATYDYYHQTCYLRIATTVSDNSTKKAIAYKAVPAGDTSASSAKKHKASGPGAKATASGSYTWWQYDASAAAWDNKVAVSSPATLQDCLTACDNDSLCAAVLVDETAGASSPPVCSLVYGSTAIDTGMRTMTRAVSTQLKPPSPIA